MTAAKNLPGIRAVLGWLVDLIYPPSCLACDRNLGPESSQFCPQCTRDLLDATGTDYCPRCGATAQPYLVSEAGCRWCRELRSPLEGFARVGPYDGIVGRMVRQYKYHGHQRADRALGAMLAMAMTSRTWCNELDALVPVPASLAERLSYRFFPVGLLAAAAAKELRLPVLPLVNVRGKRRRQVGLPASERARNVRGIFRMAKHARVEGARLCIIDDVATSNATLNEMASLLKQAGAAAVYAAVLAKSSSLAMPGRR